MQNRNISSREKQAKLIFYDEKGNPKEPESLDFSSFYPEKEGYKPGEKPKEYSEKAPISPDKVDYDFHEIETNLHVRYEAPSLDKTGHINVTVIGKLPFTTGHLIQFSGLIESQGIGEIFTLDRELLSSIGIVVYQQMPRVDKFSKKELDEIYQDIVYQVAKNVPFKSIYEILKVRFSKEFAKATKGEAITQDQYLRLKLKQKQFYAQTKASSNKKITISQRHGFKDQELVSIDFEKLKEKNPKAISQLEEYQINVMRDNTFVFLQTKDDHNSIIAIKTDNGKVIPISIPTDVLTYNRDEHDEQDMRDAFDQESPEKVESSKIINKLYKKLLTNKIFTNKEILLAFQVGLFDKMSNENFSQIMAKSPSAKMFLNYYETNKDKLTPDVVLKFIYGKIKYKLNLSTAEIDYALEHELIDGDDVGHNQKMFLKYYEEKAQSAQQFKNMNRSIKKTIMEEKIKSNYPLNEIEKSDPIYFNILRQRKMKTNLEKEHSETQEQETQE